MSVFQEQTTTFKDENPPKKRKRKPMTKEQKMAWTAYMKNYYTTHPEQKLRNSERAIERYYRKKSEKAVNALNK